MMLRLIRRDGRSSLREVPSLMWSWKDKLLHLGRQIMFIYSQVGWGIGHCIVGTYLLMFKVLMVCLWRKIVLHSHRVERSAE